MATCKKYLFNELGIYVGVGTAFANPEQKGQFLTNPKENTLIETPEFVEGQIPVFNTDTKVWEVYTDSRKNNKHIKVDRDAKVVRNLTYSELAELGLFTINSYNEIVSVDGEEVIQYKSFSKLLDEGLLDETKYQEIIAGRKRRIRDSRLSVVLREIDQYKNEIASIDAGIASTTKITNEEYVSYLQERIDLCNFKSSIDFESEKSELITETEAISLANTVTE